MNYQGIQDTSLVDGSGIRAVLWVSGCDHRCKGCHNPGTWDPDSGMAWTTGAQEYLFHLMEKNQSVRDGITLSGGDPMYPANRPAILSLCKAFRHRFRDSKTIWMYTGYKLEEIKDDPILQYIDVLVDDVFVEELADVSYPWAGSTNQTVWQRQGKEWVHYHDV